MFLLFVCSQVLLKHLETITFQVCCQSLLELVFIYFDFVLVFLDKGLLVLLVQSDKLFLVAVAHEVYVYLGKGLTSFQNEHSLLTFWGFTLSDIFFGDLNYLNMIAGWVKISSTLIGIILLAAFVIFNL